jgi:hypothetical protein
MQVVAGVAVGQAEILHQVDQAAAATAMAAMSMDHQLPEVQILAVVVVVAITPAIQEPADRVLLLQDIEFN